MPGKACACRAWKQCGEGLDHGAIGKDDANGFAWLVQLDHGNFSRLVIGSQCIALEIGFGDLAVAVTHHPTIRVSRYLHAVSHNRISPCGVIAWSPYIQTIWTLSTARGKQSEENGKENSPGKAGRQRAVAQGRADQGQGSGAARVPIQCQAIPWHGITRRLDMAQANGNANPNGQSRGNGGSPKPFRRTRPLAPLHKVGAPTLYREEYCERAVELMSDGYDITAFAGSIGVTRETVYEWMTRHGEFAHAVKIGQAARLLALQRKLLTTSMGVGVTAAIFALKNAAPDDWQDRYNTETKVTHRIEQVSDAELLSIIAQSRTIEHEPQPVLQHVDQRQHVAAADNPSATGTAGDASASAVPEGENSKP